MPPPSAGHVIHRRLQHAVVGANQVGLLSADGDGEPLCPVGLDRVARGGPGIGHRRPLFGLRTRRPPATETAATEPRKPRRLRRSVGVPAMGASWSKDSVNATPNFAIAVGRCL